MAPRPAPRKATIYDIAAATGTSAATVSLVLSGGWARQRISEQTALRVSEAARLLGYSVNLRARGLRLSRSGLAGMILPHYRNRFFADLAEAFEVEARRRDLCPIVVSTQRDREVEDQVTRTLLAQRVESLFIAGVPEPARLDQMCAAAQVGCVNLDLPGAGAPSVVSDNRGGARRLTEVLIEKVTTRGGRLEQFLYLGGVRGEYATDHRVAGFRDAMQTAGIAPDDGMLACSGYPPASASAAMSDYQARHGGLPSGVFVNSIAALEGLVDFAARLTLEQRTGLIVSCFDWDPFAAHLPFDVTMLRQDVETMMARAFATLDPESQMHRPFITVPPVLVNAPGRPSRGVSMAAATGQASAPAG